MNMIFQTPSLPKTSFKIVENLRVKLLGLQTV